MERYCLTIAGVCSLYLIQFLWCFCLKVRVPEDTAPWKDILQINAEDADNNSNLLYSVHSSLHPESTRLFHLDPKSAVLVMTEQLDYEKISTHTLIIMVTTTQKNSSVQCFKRWCGYTGLGDFGSSMANKIKG